MPSFQVNVDLTFSKGFFISGITTDFISDEWYTFSALTSLYFIIMPSVKAFIYEQKKKQSEEVKLRTILKLSKVVDTTYFLINLRLTRNPLERYKTLITAIHKNIMWK